MFDLNGRILDLLAGDVLTGEESESLFFHPGVSSLGGWWQQVPEAQRSAISGNPADTFTSDGRWHAVYLPLPSTGKEGGEPTGTAATSQHAERAHGGEGLPHLGASESGTE